MLDPNGNVTTSVNARNQTSTMAYDALNRVTSATDPLNHTVTTAYDAAGNTTRTVDAAGYATTYSYDALKRKTAVQAADTGLSRGAQNQPAMGACHENVSSYCGGLLAPPPPLLLRLRRRRRLALELRDAVAQLGGALELEVRRRRGAGGPGRR